MDYRVLLIAPLAALVVSVGAATPRLPAPWQPFSVGVSDTPPPLQQAYEIGLDPQAAATDPPSLTIRAAVPLADAPRCIAAAHQQAFGYGGRRVRFSGQLRTAGVHAWAGLYLGAGQGDLLPRMAAAGPGIDKRLPLASARVAGDGWHDVSVVVDVPADAPAIDLGLALIGEGQVWARDLRFQVVGPEVAASISTIPYDLAHVRKATAESRRQMATFPPQPLANASLD
jgi:hypothetical protein